MIVGKREEPFYDKVKRHIKECEEEKNGWEKEFQYAIKTNDESYKNYCNFMIKTLDNTIYELNKYLD